MGSLRPPTIQNLYSSFDFETFLVWKIYIWILFENEDKLIEADAFSSFKNKKKFIYFLNLIFEKKFIFVFGRGLPLSPSSTLPDCIRPCYHHEVLFDLFYTLLAA